MVKYDVVEDDNFIKFDRIKKIRKNRMALAMHSLRYEVFNVYLDLENTYF